MDPYKPMLEPCMHDYDCGLLQVCSNYVCRHKDLFPLNAWDFAVAIPVLLAAALTNAAGISDRYLVYIVLVTLGGFDGLSVHLLIYMVIWVGAADALIYRLYLRHMTRDRPRIDFSLAALACLPVLVGSYYGTLVHYSIPRWFDILLFTVILSLGILVAYTK